MKLTRKEKVLIVTYKNLQSLKAAGLVIGGAFNLTESGEREYLRLQAEGFEPTQDEIRWAVMAIIMEENDDLAKRN